MGILNEKLMTLLQELRGRLAQPAYAEAASGMNISYSRGCSSCSGDCSGDCESTCADNCAGYCVSSCDGASR